MANRETRFRTLPSGTPGMQWALVPPTVVVVAIDPWSHTCEDCVAGTHVPLERATDRQLEQMRLGNLINLTGLVWVEREIPARPQ